MKNKSILIVLISLPIILIILIVSIFVFLEIESNKILHNKIPISYQKNINEQCLEKFDLIGHKEDDSIYYFNLIPNFNSDSSLFLFNFYKKKEFKISFKKISANNLTNHSTHQRLFSLPNGISEINLTKDINDITFYVKDFTKINDNKYECNSEYLRMLINNKFSTIGYFTNKTFFIEIMTKGNQSFLSIYSSSNNQDLYLLKNVLI